MKISLGYMFVALDEQNEGKVIADAKTLPELKKIIKGDLSPIQKGRYVIVHTVGGVKTPKVVVRLEDEKPTAKKARKPRTKKATLVDRIADRITGESGTYSGTVTMEDSDEAAVSEV